MPSSASALSPSPGRLAASTAQALALTLEQVGVRHLFGMDSPEALYATIDRAAIQPVTVRDERAAAAMADAYARVSGRVGVCTGLHGAGATNLVQGLIEAWMASSAVVVLASELSRLTREKNELQEIDHLQFFAPITKWAVRVEDPVRVSEMTVRGFRLAASGRPRPVYLGYPIDVLSVDACAAPVQESELVTYPSFRIAPDPDALGVAARAIASARTPVLVAGGGVIASGAAPELAELARLLNAPVATTPLGKGAYDETLPLWLGVTGSYTGGEDGRGRIANDVIREADLAVLVGAKTDSVATADWTVPRRDATVVHIDIDPAEVQRNYPNALGIVADAKLGLQALVALLRDLDLASDWSHDMLRARIEEWEASHLRLDERSPGQPIAPEMIARDLNRFLDDDAIVTTDASYSSVWALESLRFAKPGRRLLTPRGYGALGWGLPAAIGAKFASPSSSVYCLTGDGGFGYVFQELETAARYALPLIVVVLNNRGLAFQRHYEQQFWNVDGETSFLDVQFAAIAEAMGCKGFRIAAADELSDALREANRLECPTVIDVPVDIDARPPLTLFDPN